MEITKEYIHNISPDESSTKNATKIFSKNSWIVYKSKRAVWSEIYGSGKKPYLTQMDINDIVFKCSCPSRKFPCKHSLALGLYVAHNKLDSIPTQQEPLWVQEWIDKRIQKANKKASTTPKTKSPQQIALLETKRWNSAKKDVIYIEKWLEDSIKLGILDFPNKKFDYWDGLKKRIVDLKLTGFNHLFEQLQNALAKIDWETEVILIISLIHQLVECIKHHDKLPSPLKAELAMFLGWSISKNDLLANADNETINDIWIVVNVLLDKQDKLTTRKVFLYGTSSNRWAYILEFVHANSYFQDQYIQGSIFQGELVFYDSITKQRAILKSKIKDIDKYDSTLEAFNNLAIANTNYKEALISFPWLFEYPLMIQKCNIIKQDDTYYLIDRYDNTLPLENYTQDEYIDFLLHTRGNFVDVSLLRRRDDNQILGFIQDKKVVAL